MSNISSRVDGGVMTLTFNRLDKKNSITESMSKDLADGIEQAQNDPAVRVLVFQGHETVFCAGNGCRLFHQTHRFRPRRPSCVCCTTRRGFYQAHVRIVAGPAVGIGTTLLFHCDLVLVTRRW
jgi:enoyl-CoA hydratase/carnithine racemase